MLSFYLIGFKKLFNLIKKIFLIVTIYFIIISLFFYFIKKDKPKTSYDPIEKNRKEIYKLINDPKLNSTEEGKTFIAIYRLTLCTTIGEACSENPNEADTNFNHSFFGFITNLISLPYTNPPASGVYWAYSGLQNAGFVPKTYAAEGIGFSSIKSLMSIWKVFRDLSYMFLVIIIVTVGFMIMFRVKINPQTVVSIENSLPRIATTLLIITFSFPIAGFLIDLMYITIGIIAVLFNNFPNISEGNTTVEILNNFYFPGTNNLLNKVFNTGGSFKLASSLYSIIPSSLHYFFSGIMTLIFGPRLIELLFYKIKLKGNNKQITGFMTQFIKRLPILNKFVENSSMPVLSLILALFLLFLEFILSIFLSQFVAVIFLFIILMLSIIFIFFRLFFMLLSSYIQVILLIIFSPLILSLEIIPGKSTFSSWIKNIILNLSVWPILTTIILISKILIMQTTSDNYLWRPPFLYSINPNDIGIIISMGMLFMAPEIINTLKNLLGVKPLSLPFNFGAFTSGAGAILGGSIGAMSSFHTVAMASQYGPFRFLQIFPFFRQVSKEAKEAVGGQSSPGH